MAEEPSSGQSEMISIKDFAKVKIRIGKVIEANYHPNADTLLVLKVDLGDEQRQICAGIKGHYTPEQLVGRHLAIVTNLPTRMIRGQQSQGMLLAAVSDDQSRVVVLTTEAEIEPGTAVS